MLRKLWSITLILSLLTACGGGGNPTSNNTSSDAVIDGYLDNVSGVSYKTSSGLKGETGFEGKYNYREGDTVSFYVNDIKLGSLNAKRNINVFSFNNPEVVIQILYSLDSDFDPQNGLDILSTTKKSLNKIISFIDIDSIEVGSKEYIDLIKQYGGDLVSSNEAINTELFKAFREIDIDQSDYKILLGDFPIATSSRYYDSLTFEAQKNINARIKRLVYRDNFHIISSGLSAEFSNDISNIDKQYQSFIKDTEDKLKDYDRIKSTLIAALSGDGKAVIQEGAKYAIDNGTEFAKELLGDGSGAEIIGASGAMLSSCVSGVSTKKDVLSCLNGSTNAGLNAYLEIAYKDQLTLKAGSQEFATMVSDVADIYIKCSSILLTGNLIDCASSTLQSAYKSTAKVVASVNGIIQISKAKDLFYSQEAAIGLLETLSYLGTLENSATFLNTTGISVSDLLEAEFKSRHPDFSASGIFSDYDSDMAASTFTELSSEFNRIVSIYKNKKEYQSLFIENDTGQITGISNSFYKNTQGRYLAIDIRSVKLTSSNNLHVCYGVKNNGVRDISLFDGKVLVKGSKGEISLNEVEPKTIELSYNTLNNARSKCSFHQLFTEEKSTIGDEFVVTLSYKYKVRQRGNTVILIDNTYVASDVRAYEGVNFPDKKIPTISLEKTKSLDANNNVIPNKFDVVTHIDYPSSSPDDISSFSFDWSTSGGTLKSNGDSTNTITIDSDTERLSVGIKDSDDNNIGQQSIMVRDTDEIIYKSLSTENIYKSVFKGDKVIIRPRVSGGKPPYILTFHEENVSHLSLIKDTISYKRYEVTKNVSSGYYLNQIYFTVTDDLGNTQTGIADITIESGIPDAKVSLGKDLKKKEGEVVNIPITISHHSYSPNCIVLPKVANIDFAQTNSNIRITIPDYDKVPKISIICAINESGGYQMATDRMYINVYGEDDTVGVPFEAGILHSLNAHKLKVGDSITLTAYSNFDESLVTSYVWKEGTKVLGNEKILVLSNLTEGEHLISVTITMEDINAATKYVDVRTSTANTSLYVIGNEENINSDLSNNTIKISNNEGTTLFSNIVKKRIDSYSNGKTTVYVKAKNSSWTLEFGYCESNGSGAAQVCSEGDWVSKMTDTTTGDVIHGGTNFQTFGIDIKNDGINGIFHGGAYTGRFKVNNMQIINH